MKLGNITVTGGDADLGEASKGRTVIKIGTRGGKIVKDAGGKKQYLGKPDAVKQGSPKNDKTGETDPASKVKVKNYFGNWFFEHNGKVVKEGWDAEGYATKREAQEGGLDYIKYMRDLDVLGAKDVKHSATMESKAKKHAASANDD